MKSQTIPQNQTLDRDEQTTTQIAETAHHSSDTGGQR